MCVNIYLICILYMFYMYKTYIVGDMRLFLPKKLVYFLVRKFKVLRVILHTLLVHKKEKKANRTFKTYHILLFRTCSITPRHF